MSKEKIFLIINALCISVMSMDFSRAFQTGVVRLAGGSGPYEGRVEIFLNGKWGTVHDDPWDNDDAEVVCRQLGYLFRGIAYSGAHFGEGIGPIWLDGIECAGNESTLLSCPHQTNTAQDSHAEDVGVACDGEVRLADGTGPYEGRVEIFMNGQWGTVDEDPWDNDDAGVVCRQLGYSFGGVAYKSAHFGEGSGPIWLDDIGCIGSETHLLDCPHQTDTSEDSHSEDVGVACNGEVRLANGHGAFEGRVEIFMNGQWGTVDEDPWDDNDARVVCRQLGYIYGGTAYRSAYFGEGSGPIWLDGIGCIGTETHLLNCTHETDTSEDSHNEDVGVVCKWPATDLCSSQPCLNNGQCVNQIDSYLCVCQGGYRGHRCEIVIDPCDTHPCENNGVCFVGRDDYLCLCQDGFEGRRCENATDLCSSQPCTNNGRCINQKGSFLCVCEIGYGGLRCENVTDPCESHPCEHNGLCINESNGYLCICPDGFEGRQCEIDFDPCDNEGCSTSEDCVQRLNRRFCTCEDSANETILCEYDIDPCSSSPCKVSEKCLPKGSRYECVVAEKLSRHITGITITSMILALSALLAATIALVKIQMMTGTDKQQSCPSASVRNDSHVQMQIQPNQYGNDVTCITDCQKQQEGVSCQMTSVNNDGDQDIYENY